MGTLINLWILCFKMEIVLCISDFNIATLEKVWIYYEFDTNIEAWKKYICAEFHFNTW